MIAWLQQFILAGHPLTVWIGWTWTISSIVLTTWIILQRKSPVSTLAWIMVLNLMPVVGLLVYAYFGPQRIKRQRLKRWHKRAALMSREDVSALRAERPDVPAWAVQHARLIEEASGLPMSSAQSVDVLASGGATLDALLREIDGARGHIHLEYYIFEPDETGSRLLQALIAKARAGVKVRLLVDAIGSPKLLSRRHRQLLDEFRAAGGEFAVFHPARLDRLRPLVNLRTHRK
ncbi:MAG: PLDc N-terminal domain-containing protein, partial [Ottowia sp.]|nr:PLDc N-terminal domain-containing protein [Ottowia sp.]